MQQLEHVDMSNDNNANKPAVLERKPSRPSPAPQLPQINPPLMIDGPELLRDSHC